MVVIPIVGPALLSTICFVKDLDARLGADLSLAVVRLARQLRFRRAESPVSLSRLSALSALAAMTPGALAVRESVRLSSAMSAMVDEGA
jgi:hypothetical protein